MEGNTCYGKSSERMVGYPSRIVTKTFGKFQIRDDLQKMWRVGWFNLGWA